MMRVASLVVMLFASPFLMAETSVDIINEGEIIDNEVGNMATDKAVDRVASNFTDFLGDQAAIVVEGLRKGEEFTLTSTYTDSSGMQQTETITIEPPTGKMGYGNVNITLKLAEYQLGEVGITEPTALELESTLIGGSITTPDGQVVDMQGVLTLRSEGMGWGQIAQQYDTRLGYIMGNGHSKNTSMTTAPGDTSGENDAVTMGMKKASAGNAGKGHAYGQGIVTASGSPATTVISHGNGNAYGASKAHGGGATSVGSNIVSTGGSNIHGNNAGGNGNAYGRSK